MMEILNNPWIIAIGSSVISGLIVYFVTNRLLVKRHDKEYSQKVTTANNELLYTMRPLVVQKQIPSKFIMESIIESIARKYEVNKNDLLNILFIVNDLIREVMENAFLDSDQKIEFCNKVSELRVKETTPKEIKQIYEKLLLYQKDRISYQYVSFLLAFIASMMVLVGTFVTTTRDRLNFEGLNNLSEVSSIMFLSMIVPMVAMIMTMFIKKIKKHERDKKDEEFDEKLKKFSRII